MKKLSLWAKHHKWQARLVIVVSFILLIILGVLTGSLLKDLGILLPGEFLWSVILIVFLAVVFYPDRKNHGGNEVAKNRHYIRQKACDLGLSLSTYLLIVGLANVPQHLLPSYRLFNHTMATTVVIVPGDSVRNVYQSATTFSKSLRDDNGNLLKWKERKKLLKVQVKAIKQSTELSDNGKAGLIILAVLLAIGIAFGLAFLVCSISCGSPVIGVIAFASGLALFTILFVLVLKKIKRKNKGKEDPSAGN